MGVIIIPYGSKILRSLLRRASILEKRATFSEINRIVELFPKLSRTFPPVCERSNVRRKELTKRNHGNSIAFKKMLNLLRVKVCFTGEI
jgi:hypothetical protein